MANRLPINIIGISFEMAFISEGKGLNLIPKKLDLWSIIKTLDILEIKICADTSITDYEKRHRASIKTYLSLALFQTEEKSGTEALQHLEHFYGVDINEIVNCYPEITATTFWTEIVNDSNIYILDLMSLPIKFYTMCNPKEIMAELFNQEKVTIIPTAATFLTWEYSAHNMTTQGFVCLDKIMHKTKTEPDYFLRKWRIENPTLAEATKMSSLDVIKTPEPDDMPFPARELPMPDVIDQIKKEYAIYECSSKGCVSYRLFKNGLMVMIPFDSKTITNLQILYTCGHISRKQYCGVFSAR
jgi:hypothetical protein